MTFLKETGQNRSHVKRGFIALFVWALRNSEHPSSLDTQDYMYLSFHHQQGPSVSLMWPVTGFRVAFTRHCSKKCKEGARDSFPLCCCPLPFNPEVDEILTCPSRSSLMCVALCKGRANIYTRPRFSCAPFDGQISEGSHRWELCVVAEMSQEQSLLCRDTVCCQSTCTQGSPSTAWGALFQPSWNGLWARLMQEFPLARASQGLCCLSANPEAASCVGLCCPAAPAAVTQRFQWLPAMDNQVSCVSCSELDGQMHLSWGETGNPSFLCLLCG